MIAHEFDGRVVTLPTKGKGSASFGLGKVVPAEGDEPEPACYIGVRDENGDEVIRAALTPTVFDALLTAMKMVMDAAAAAEAP